jgi:hypothetical protein
MQPFNVSRRNQKYKLLSRAGFVELDGFSHSVKKSFFDQIFAEFFGFRFGDVIGVVKFAAVKFQFCAVLITTQSDQQKHRNCQNAADKCFIFRISSLF